MWELFEYMIREIFSQTCAWNPHHAKIRVCDVLHAPRPTIPSLCHCRTPRFVHENDHMLSRACVELQDDIVSMNCASESWITLGCCAESGSIAAGALREKIVS